MKTTYRVELAKKTKWFWRIVSAKNGQTILTSETYATKFNAKRQALKLAAKNKLTYKEIA